MLKQFGTFIAWLSGSLAGITAGLYAFGFVATIGADELLGMTPGLNSRDAGFYIGRGGNLVMRTVIIAMWPALLVVTLGALVSWAGHRFGRAADERPGLLRRAARAAALPAASLAMFALAFVGLTYFIDPALDARNLLFASEVPPEACRARDPLTMAIFAQERDSLGLWFAGMAALAGTVAGLGALSRARLVEAGQGVWLSVASIAAFLTLVEVPLAYGVLAVETAPPPVRVEPPPDGQTDGLRLLARSADGILVWLEDERLVRWISSREISSFTVGAGAPIPPLSCGGGGR